MVCLHEMTLACELTFRYQAVPLEGCCHRKSFFVLSIYEMYEDR